MLPHGQSPCCAVRNGALAYNTVICFFFVSGIQAAKPMEVPVHIAEGVLSPPVLALGGALAIAGVGYGLRRLEHDRLMTVGLLSALFFVASLVHVPVGFASAHLIANGLMGIFLGWASFPALFVALLLQAVLFQFGGLLVLGVNTCTMAGGAMASWLIFRLVLAGRPWGSSLRLACAAFLAGASGPAVAAFLTALALSFSAEGFMAAAITLFLAHLPIMAAEGALTMLAVSFIARIRPQMLHLAEPGLVSREAGPGV